MRRFRVSPSSILCGAFLALSAFACGSDGGDGPGDPGGEAGGSAGADSSEAGHGNDTAGQPGQDAGGSGGTAGSGDASDAGSGGIGTDPGASGAAGATGAQGGSGGNAGAGDEGGAGSGGSSGTAGTPPTPPLGSDPTIPTNTFDATTPVPRPDAVQAGETAVERALDSAAELISATVVDERVVLEYLTETQRVIFRVKNHGDLVLADMDCEALGGTSEIVMGVASTSWIGTSAVITSSRGLCFSTEVYVSDVLDLTLSLSVAQSAAGLVF
jgi:hypothetical protein